MNDGIVAVVHAAGNDKDFSRETAEANARLIAAAPALHGICKLFLRLCEANGYSKTLQESARELLASIE